MTKINYFHLRLSDEELSKLNEFSVSSKCSKSDVLRSLIMNSNTNDNTSVEILRRIFMLIQINLTFMKKVMPNEVTDKWLNRIAEEARKIYPKK